MKNASRKKGIPGTPDLRARNNKSPLSSADTQAHARIGRGAIRFVGKTFRPPPWTFGSQCRPGAPVWRRGGSTQTAGDLFQEFV